MGAIQNLVDGQTVGLASRVLVGRGGAASLSLPDPLISGEHAVIWWDGTDWCIRDLGSKNGTFVAGRRITIGGFVSLAPGDVLGFGREEGWRFVEGGAPSARALDPRGLAMVADDGFLCLPDADDPQVIVYRGPYGRWLADEDGVTRRIEADSITVGDQVYTLDLPRLHDATLDGGSLGADVASVAMRFALSRDEEHVECTVQLANGWRKLEPRAHHFLLLALARCRIDDASCEPAECGWVHVDDLCRMLGVRRGLLNMQILRVRREMEGLGLSSAADVIERRSLAGTLRLITRDVSIRSL